MDTYQIIQHVNLDVLKVNTCMKVAVNNVAVDVNHANQVLSVMNVKKECCYILVLVQKNVLKQLTIMMESAAIVTQLAQNVQEETTLNVNNVHQVSLNIRLVV